MKFLILIAIVCSVLKVNALPTPAEVDEDTETATIETATLSDLKSPLRLEVKHQTQIFVTKFKDVYTKVLTQLPQTEEYAKPRKYLTKIVESNDMFVNELANCIWNLVDLQFNAKQTILYLTRPNATEAEKETGKLLMDNDYDDLRQELGNVWWKFILGEYGQDYNEDYCDRREEREEKLKKES